MRLLFDQNLSRTLVRRLAIEFPDSVHVTDVGLDTASDRQIWNYAGEQGFVIVSKDSDFRQLAFLIGPPPKAVWLRMGNSSTLDILTVLRDYREAIDEFSRSEDEALLVTARHRHDRIATGQGVPNITGFGCASVAGRTRLPASGDRGLLASATVRSIGSVPRWVVSHNRRYGAPRPSPPWGSSPCSARRDTARFAHGIGNWVALAGVITALVSTVTASWLSYREAAASRLERDKDRTSDRRGRGRQQALATLVPLFAFVADLEAVAGAADRDPDGFARYVRESMYTSWTRNVRPIVIGLQVSSFSADTRTAASKIVRVVDDALTSATYELEFAGEELDSEALQEATEQLVGCVGRLRTGADRLAELVREDG